MLSIDVVGLGLLNISNYSGLLPDLPDDPTDPAGLGFLTTLNLFCLLFCISPDEADPMGGLGLWNNKFSERSLVYSDRSLICPDRSLSCPVRSLVWPERSLSYPVRSLVCPDLLLVYSDLSLIYADCSTGGSSRFVKNSGNFGIALLSAEDSALGSGSVIFVIFEA